MANKTVSTHTSSSKTSASSYFPPTPPLDERAPTPVLLGSSDDEGDDGGPLATPSKGKALASPLDAESYFNSLHSLKSSRANSVCSLSRISLSSQLSQLTALSLPDPSSLAPSISAIPTAPAAASTLSSAAEQINKWLQKATEVLHGLDAEDDVEWAAAGGREGLAEVDLAIGKFEGLIGVYVTAIEDLQEREDVSKVPPEQLKDQVDQMEIILKEWEGVRRSLKEIKSQVELAMEWEELWNVVLGDIGLELENLASLVFEMEEARHKAVETVLDGNGSLDLQELDTIVEEAPLVNGLSTSQQPNLLSGVEPSSPLSPSLSIPQDDSRLLALFARMQPLRASLDFLPMTLSSFQHRAQKALPSACQELEGRRKTLEKKWSALERDAHGLRQELGEDRWVVVFRNAARQAHKLCESVERSITKLQESIDIGTQHSNPPLLAKKVEGYEAKKSHYGPAIRKVLAIIEKGVTDRQTVNGEILRVHLDTKARWQNIETDMKNMDVALEDLTLNKNQQLRDSISSIVSVDHSATGSTADTPGSSPASSIAMGPISNSKRDESPGMKSLSRKSSTATGSMPKSNGSRRHFSMPPGSAPATSLPRKSAGTRSFTSDFSSRTASPVPYTKSSATPTPGSRPQRPTLITDNKPRWNSSPKVEYFEYSSKPQPYPFSTPPLHRKKSSTFHSLNTSGSHHSSSLPVSSPLGRSSPSSGAKSATLTHRPRISNGSQSVISSRCSSIMTPNFAYKTPVSDRQTQQRSMQDGTMSGTEEDPSPRPRPSSSMGNSRRVSMLPVPKNPAFSPLASGSGRESAIGTRTTSHGRINSLGNGRL